MNKFLEWYKKLFNPGEGLTSNAMWYGERVDGSRGSVFAYLEIEEDYILVAYRDFFIHPEPVYEFFEHTEMIFPNLKTFNAWLDKQLERMK